MVEWKNYSVLIEYLPLPFFFLERNEFKKTGEPQIKNIMLMSWNTIIFSKVFTRLLNAAINLIEQERNGEAIDPELIIGVRESFGNFFYNFIKKFFSAIKL